MIGIAARPMRRHITFANVMSLFAAFVALGGTGYAVTQLPAGSVGTKQLKKSAVTSAKIGTGQVKAADLGAGVVTSGKLAAGAVGAAAIADGTVASADIADGTIATGDVADGGVELADLSTAAVTSLHAIDASLVGSQASPSGTGGVAVDSQSFSLTRAGRVFVTTSVPEIETSCAGGACVVSAAVTIDGALVPGAFAQNSQADGASNAKRFDLAISGISGTLAAGTHSIQTKFYSTSFATGSVDPPNSYSIIQLA
jgi:hypothetical protein